MQNKQVDEKDAALTGFTGKASPRAVIVELTGGKAARIREAPPNVLVMVVESKEITAAGKRAVAAGGSGEVHSPHAGEPHHGTETRQIQVSFPG